MSSIELRTRVGPDGVLTLTIPFGITEANREVKVVVESAEDLAVKPGRGSLEDWERFVASTAGAWKGNLERPEPGELEVRDQWP